MTTAASASVLPSGSIELGKGTPDEGFPSMLAELLRQNLADHESKRRTFQKMVGRVSLIATDIDVSATLHFMGGSLRVHNGVVGIPDVTIRAPSDAFTKMSLIEIGRFGLPKLSSPVVKELRASMKAHEIDGHGMASNLPLLMRLTRVMSVY